MTPYDPNWTHADSAGLVDATMYHSRVDLEELADAINRRRLLVIKKPLDYARVLDAHPYVSQHVLTQTDYQTPGDPNPVVAMRDALVASNGGVLTAAPRQDYLYTPPSPESIAWLWPDPDADENKTIARWLASPSPTEVGLFNRLNGLSTWTDPSPNPGGFPGWAKAVHLNELRRVVALLRRGRWELPIQWVAGLFSAIPGTPWTGHHIANDGANELRSVGGVRFAPDLYDGLPYGLRDVTARAASISLTFNDDCHVELRQVTRPVLFGSDMPSWDYYRSASQQAWASPGGAGAGDSVPLGTFQASKNVPVTLNDPGLLPMTQAMLDDATPPYFLLRQLDVGTSTVGISDSTITVDFELNSPPA